MVLVHVPPSVTTTVYEPESRPDIFWLVDIKPVELVHEKLYGSEPPETVKETLPLVVPWQVISVGEAERVGGVQGGVANALKFTPKSATSNDKVNNTRPLV